MGVVYVSNSGGGASGSSAAVSDAAADLRLLAHDFLLHFRVQDDFVYRRQLQENLSAGSFYIEVEMAHLQQFNTSLGQAVQHSPVSTLSILEQAVWEVATQRRLLPPAVLHQKSLVSIQVQIFWGVQATPLRQLARASVSRLVSISGIVLKSSTTHPRCTRAAIQCTSCRSKTFISGRRNISLPPQCLENGGSNSGAAAGMLGGAGGGGGGGSRRCRPNPYVLLPMECSYEDQQVLKLQELPEEVPTGELPRHVTVVVDRYLVDCVSPGSRIQIAAIVCVQESRGAGIGGEGGGRRQSGGGRQTIGLRAQYLRCVGLMQISAVRQQSSGGMSMMMNDHQRVSRARSVLAWQPDEEASFKAFAKAGNVYDKLSRSIDPAIFGLTDPKRAIVCLLFGGTRKRQGSNYLRGDMNVLLVGDPSTAKSQLLKFTERVAPISIYTSGKGSSAAGLTAAVVSNGNGDFALEAGSMVLADGGVVCIDEFDKMRDQDQVAIHEAMEQQTISVAKANLNTMLNSRTSVLAAANPTLGCYDPLRSNEDQMDFQSSILSRFDLIFKILDPRNPETDRNIALHVMALHKTSGSGGSRRAAAQMKRHINETNASGADGEQEVVDLAFMTKYIAFARATCFPSISEEAMAVLLDFYVQVRRDSHQQTLASLHGQSGKSSSGGGGSSTSSGAPLIQITARQLESLVRITESQAKMRLDILANRSDAEEAVRLFRAATVDAISSGVVEQNLTEEQSDYVLRIEEAIRRRVSLGSTVEHRRLLAELSKIGFNSGMVDRALFAMVRREELAWRKQRTLLHRLR